jgi:hypothetical protein
MSSGDDLAIGPPSGDELAMVDAKRILKDIILKIATESLGTFKQDFLDLPLNEQKRILREHGLKQGVFSMSLHSLQKRLGWRSNNNSRTSPKFREAQEAYFNDTIDKRYNIIVSKLKNTEPDKSIKTILNFLNMYRSRIIYNPKMKLYEWLKSLQFSPYPGIERVIPWAIDKYFMEEEEEEERQLAARERRLPGLPARRRGAWRGREIMAHPPYPPPAPMDYRGAEEAPPEQVLLENTPQNPGYNLTSGGGSRRKSQRRRRRTRRH